MAWLNRTSQTNEKIIDLVKLLGLPGKQIQPPPNLDSNGKIFMTNSFCCVVNEEKYKEITDEDYKLSSPPLPKWFSVCDNYLKRLIADIIKPRVIISLGTNATNTILLAFGEKKISVLRNVVEKRGINLPRNIVLFPVYHPRRRLKDRSDESVKSDWKHIRDFLKGKTSVIVESSNNNKKSLKKQNPLTFREAKSVLSEIGIEYKYTNKGKAIRNKYNPVVFRLKEKEYGLALQKKVTGDRWKIEKQLKTLKELSKALENEIRYLSYS